MVSRVGARERRRDSTASPPPALSIGKSHSFTSLDPKSRRVDIILSKGVEQQNTALQCFNLAAKYRNNPRYHPQNAFKHLRGAASLPSSPRGVPLQHSQSMPGDLNLGLTNRAGCVDLGQRPRAASAPPPPPPPDPRCERCLGGDPELEKNKDSAMVCVDCGTVHSLSEMKSQARFKNCDKSKDNSSVGDVPPTQSAQEAYYHSWSNGPESEEDKRRRERVHIGGTRMPTSKLKKNKLIDAQNQIDKEAKRNADEMLQQDGGPDQGRRKKIILRLENVFDQLPHLDERFRVHIRREAIRIYSNSMKHEKVCGQKCCMLALSQRTNIVIAYGVVEYALEALANPQATQASGALPGSPVTTIASLAPDWSKKEVQTQLAVLNEVQVRNSNQVLRMQVLSAISILADPTEGTEGTDLCVPCAGEPGPGPDPDRPPSREGMRTSTDVGDAAVALRERINATASSSHASESSRKLAVEQLAVLETVAFLKDVNPPFGHPIDLVAISLLAASAIKLSERDPTVDLRAHCLPKHNVSETTMREFIDQLTSLIKGPQASCQEDAIF